MPPEDDDDKEANKLNHIFNKKEHKLDDFLNKFENNQQQAYNAIIKELEKDMANGNCQIILLMVIKSILRAMKLMYVEL